MNPRPILVHLGDHPDFEKGHFIVAYRTDATGRPRARRVALRRLVALRPGQEMRRQRFERSRALPTPCTGRLLGEGEATAALLQDTRRDAGDRLRPYRTPYWIATLAATLPG